MQTWSVVYTKPNQEVRAAIELTKQDFHVYSPIHFTRPLFPRYIFAEFDRDQDNWGLIRSTRGCIDVLKNGFRPIIVQQTVMEAIMAFKPTEDGPEIDPVFTANQRVRINSGILQGYEGLFTGSDKQRTQAFLDILGNKVSVALKTISPAA